MLFSDVMQQTLFQNVTLHVNLNGQVCVQQKGEGRGGGRKRGIGKEGEGKIKPQQESVVPESYHCQVRQLDLTCHLLDKHI